MSIKNWIANHKALAIWTGIIIGIIVVVVIAWGISSFREEGSSDTMMGMPAPGAANMTGSRFPFSPGNWMKSNARREGNKVSNPSSQLSEIEVKEGWMTIKSKNAEDDFQRASARAKEYGGYVESNNKNITNTSVVLNATLRVPADKFEGLVNELKRNFDVRSYRINNYRLPIQRELDEIDLLNKTLTSYEKMRKEIESMPTGDKKISLLMNLTNQELSIKQREKNYQRELSSKQRQGELATIHLVIEQKKSPRLWPEDIGNNFKNRMSLAFKTSIAILENIVGGGIELFFRVLEFIIFAIIIIVPVFAAWKLARIIYWKYRR